VLAMALLLPADMHVSCIPPFQPFILYLAHICD
jgi:hypothetical protein